MATNPYTRSLSFPTTGEQNLLEDLTVEMIRNHGVDVYYLPRTQDSTDEVLGEVRRTSFNNAFEIEMYSETINEFGGEQDLLSPFGLEVRDQVELVVAKKTFRELVEPFSDRTKPQEGDLVYFPLSESFFEIRFVEHENIFYQVGKLFSWKLTLELFKFSHETFATGVYDIDQIATKYANTDDASNDPFSDNVDIETAADGSVTDGFDDTGNRDDGIIDWSEEDPFSELKY